LKRRAFLFGLPLGLSACAAQSVWAPDDVVSRAIYRAEGPRHLTLYTMRNTQSGSGAHTALLIDASQRVIFDPAGTWRQDIMPERNDVLFGASPRMEQVYVSVHARTTYFVTGQRIDVSPQVAEQALNLALAAGPVPAANCTRVTSRMLRQLPGFESIRQTWGPNTLAEDFGRLPGVITTVFREDDDADKSVATARLARQLRAGQ
jgi:hypothetical protein